MIGATPQTMSAIDMNQALQRGGIDGLLQGWTGMRTFGTLFLTDSVIEIPTGSIAFMLLINRDRWNSLPESVRAAMQKHGGEGLARRGGAAYDRMAAEIRASTVENREYEIIAPDAATYEQQRRAAQTLHDEWVERTSRGPEVLARFKAIIENIKGGNER
jgi:TRAP-type C4-dicarboxylate transport system substrate-binding protein